MKNFKNFDELIHSNEIKIDLTSDIILSNDEEKEYLNGIRLDVDNLIINGNHHSINACGKTRIFECIGKNITLKNIVFKNGFSQELCGTIINFADVLKNRKLPIHR